MINYTVVLSKKAEKQLNKFSDNTAAPIIRALEALQSDPRPVGYIKLKGRNGYRIRVGNYRIIYDILDVQLLVDVIAIGHRKEIYLP